MSREPPFAGFLTALLTSPGLIQPGLFLIRQTNHSGHLGADALGIFARLLSKVN